jgi:hypothetical protein
MPREDMNIVAAVGKKKFRDDLPLQAAPLSMKLKRDLCNIIDHNATR